MPKIHKTDNAVSAKSSNPSKTKSRAVLYPEPQARICMGKDALTVSQAKDLLDWDDSDVADGNYTLVDRYGKKVRLWNNIGNRPFDMATARKWCSEILHHRWKLNGETLIIGKTGVTVSAQHRLIGLVLAWQEWAKNKERWAKYWPTEPVLETCMILGVDEDDATVNTIDTGKPRTLWEVICRSEYFAAVPEKGRKILARMTHYALQLLWDRTRASLGNYSNKRSHADSLDLLARHERLLECVKHIFEENTTDTTEDGERVFRIGQWVSPGYAACLCYLMGQSHTDYSNSDYRLADVPHEGLLDWSLWDKARDFWVELAGGSKALQPLRDTLVKARMEGTGSAAEKTSIFANAWTALMNGDKLSVSALTPDYHINDAGQKELLDYPAVGGIDLGCPDEDEEETTVETDPTPEEIEESKKEVRKPKAEKLVLNPKRAGKMWSKDDVAWIEESDGDHYLGKLLDDPYKCNNGQEKVMVHSQDGDWEVDLSQLTLAKPTSAPKPATKAKFPKSKAPEKTKKLPTSKPKAKVGTLTWVFDRDGEHWRGRIVESNDKVVRVKVDTGFRGAGNVQVVAVADLRQAQPR
ncbi:hypothetical protein M0R72_07560 [Candidatus Pacearchaeota archaeon]|jgi:hypothetical protein|nr:hypothetical protein [Candidatus Pacearchaeota archaeon]